MIGNQPGSDELDAAARELLADHGGRPAWVFSADGDTLIWANDDGLALLLADSMQTARAAGIKPTVPATRSLQAVARTPVQSAGRGRIEILRINTGGQQETLVATCKPIELAGQRVVLALGSLRNTRSLRQTVAPPTEPRSREVATNTIMNPRPSSVDAGRQLPEQSVRIDAQGRRHSASEFEFQPRSRPHRFSFTIELDGRIAGLSSGLADAVGEDRGLNDGETASLAVAERTLDATPALVRALANRQRFSEQTVLWPVTNTLLAVPVRLSGFGEDDGSLRVFGTVLTAKAQSAVSAEAVAEPAVKSDTANVEPEPPLASDVSPIANPEETILVDATSNQTDASGLLDAAAAIVSGFKSGLSKTVMSEQSESPGSAIEAPNTDTPTTGDASQVADRDGLPEVDDAPWDGLSDADGDRVAEEPTLLEPADDASVPDQVYQERVAAEQPPVLTNMDHGATASGGQVALEGADADEVKTSVASIEAPEPNTETQSAASAVETNPSLSRPERLTFQEIARRLGARITGRDDSEKPQEAIPTNIDEVETMPAEQADVPAPERLLSTSTTASPFSEEQIGVGTSDEQDVLDTDLTNSTPGDGDADISEPDEIDDLDDLVDGDEVFDGEERRTSLPPRLRVVDRNTTPQDALRAVEETIGPRTTGQILPFRVVEGTAERQLLDRIPLGLIVYADDKLLYANKTALDMIGLQSIDALRAYSRVEKLFEGGMAGRDGAMTLLRLDGTKTRVTGRLQSIRWDNQPAALLSIQDARGDRSTAVSMPATAALASAADQPTTRERSQALQLVQAQVAELEAIIDLASDGVVTLDRTGEIKSLNQAAQALVGYGADDLVGRPFRLLFAEDSRQMALDYLEDMAGQGKLSLFNQGREVECLTAQGGLVPVFMTLGLLTDEQPPLFCAVLRDLSPFKQAESDLVEARRAAERANAHKSDFLARVSHEIRTPLNAVIGFSEVMLEERFGPVGSERYRQYLRDIHTSGEHLMSLLNDLLDLSKIEAGRMELSFGEVDLNDVVQQCLAIMQPQASQARIIVRTSLPLSVPKVVSDVRSIRQVVLNLMSNAIKFTDAGGQIIVSTLYEPTGEVSLRVRDTGRGMTSADVELALEPFRQVPTTINQVITGTGLGLPLTKALVEANKAQFALESTPGEGTLAKVTFPSQRVLAE
ncbi:MAG: histidine kinase dimerization/phospho-acceptor domain-containing protein [Pseudomonadota bacterium]